MGQKEEILRLTNGGLDVFNHYIEGDIARGKMFRNPLYADTKASCHIVKDKNTGRYYLKDFGDPDSKGDCFWFVAQLMGVDEKTGFKEILNRIIGDLGLSIFKENLQSTPHKKMINMERNTKPTKPISLRSEYEIRRMCWDETTFSFWKRYGITAQVLASYGVVPLQNYTACGEKGRYTINGSLTAPIYGYIGEGYVKIYRPFSDVRFMWLGQKPSPYIFGFAQLPKSGDIVFITGGEKDVLTLAAHGFAAVCFNSETAEIAADEMTMLCERFSHVVMMYDCDETGKRVMEKAAGQFRDYEEFMTLLLPLEGTKTSKDISDYFAAGHSVEEFEVLVDTAIKQAAGGDIILCESCEMQFATPPSPSRSVISVNGVPIGVNDNLMVVTGGSGTGKSHFVGGLEGIAMHLNKPGETALGYMVERNYDEKAIIHFDTEQSEYQVYKNAMRNFKVADIEQAPEYYHSYCISHSSVRYRLRIVKKAMDELYRRHKGIHLVVIDGAADLVRSVNDESESIESVNTLYGLAQKYHTCIVCVVHFVPGGQKVRGHYGSELHRKAAGIISVEKDVEDESVSVIKAVKVRDGNPMDVPTIFAKYAKEHDRFVLIGKKDTSQNKENNQVKMIAEEVLAGKLIQNYAQLVEEVMKSAGVATRTAKEYISKMYSMNYVRKTKEGYILNTQKGEE